MIDSIQAAYSAIQGALTIAQGVHALKTDTAINQAVIDIQRGFLDAQRGLTEAEARHGADMKRISELENEITRLKDWSKERERYEPVDIYLGSIAYMPKIGMENGEPPHWLCANCFENGKKSFLQFKGQTSGTNGGRGIESTYGCDSCKGSIRVSWRTKPAFTYAKRAGLPEE